MEKWQLTVKEGVEELDALNSGVKFSITKNAILEKIKNALEEGASLCTTKEEFTGKADEACKEAKPARGGGKTVPTVGAFIELEEKIADSIGEERGKE